MEGLGDNRRLKGCIAPLKLALEDVSTSRLCMLSRHCSAAATF